MATTWPVCPICGKAHASCGGGAGPVVAIGFVEQEPAMSGELETITLTNGRRVRVNERDKARYARKGVIVGQETSTETDNAPKTVGLPRKKAVKGARNKAVQPVEDKGEE